MIIPDERNKIINKINNYELVSETITGQKYDWWRGYHNPSEEIPRNIYLLGKGTIAQLHNKYLKTYGNIEWDIFINFTRELIKQKIMV